MSIGGLSGEKIRKIAIDLAAVSVFYVVTIFIAWYVKGGV